MTWQELADVRLPDDEAVPRLDELLAAWPEVRWNIDVKHDTAVEPLIDTAPQNRVPSNGCASRPFPTAG